MMTRDPEITQSEDYELLIKGEINSEEYAKRLRHAIELEEEGTRDSGDEARIAEVLKGPSVFVSYSHEDKAVARNLARELEKRGAAVWIDEGELRIGDSIIDRIASAIADVDYVIVLVSPASVDSPWCRKELSLAATNVLARQGVKVLPLRLNQADMPASLRDLLYLDLDPSQIEDAAERIFNDILGHHQERAAQIRQQLQIETHPHPPSELNWGWEESRLIRSVIAFIRKQDEIPVTGLLNDLPRAVRTAEQEGPEALDRLLDRFTAVYGTFLTYGLGDWADRAGRGLNRIYNETLNQRGNPRSDLPMQPESIWLAVIVRLEALGGLATRLERWDHVRQLALQPTREADGGYYPFILRHGLTMASRANLFDRAVNEDTQTVSLITLAQECTQRIPALTSDVPHGDDEVLTSVCQFDVLAAITAMGEAETIDGRVFYTNFARFHSTRVDPVVRRLTVDEEMRTALFPGDDASLALVLRELGDRGKREGFRFNGFWGFDDEAILEFFRNHPVSDEQLAQWNR